MGPRGPLPAEGPEAPAPSGPSKLRRALGVVPGLLPLARGLRGSLHTIRGAARDSAFWPERIRRVRALDLLIVAGSNQLSDNFGGPWAFPYTLAAWSAASRLAGTPVAFLSMGAGPIRSPWSRRLLRAALSWSSYRSYRDVGSKDAIQAIGVSGPHRIVPDLAHGLRVDLPDPKRNPFGGRTIVVNPFPYRHPRFSSSSDLHAYRRYVDTLARFAADRLDRGDRIRFVPTQLRQDPPVIADILRAMGGRARPGDQDAALDPPVHTFDDLMRALSEADLVVATRFHGVVLSQMLGKPVVGIAYRRSTPDLLEDVGHGAYVVDGMSLTLEGLQERVEAIASDAGAAERIAKRVREYRIEVEAQFDAVLQVVRSSRSGVRPGATS